MQVLKSWLAWAYAHNKNTDPKYSSLTHPLFISITGTMLFMLVILVNANYLLDDTPVQKNCQWLGVFLIVYFFFMMISRYVQNGPVSIYQSLWACNQCLLLVSICTFINNAQLIRACLIAVSLDQLLWYIDMFGFIFFRKFPIGVAKYILWPETSKMRLLTTFHHLWFMPLCLWIVYPSYNIGFNFSVYLQSCMMTFMLALIGRISVPKQIVIKLPKKQQSFTVYMNINITRQLWKDVNIQWIKKCYQGTLPIFVPFVLSGFWNCSNVLGFTLLNLIQYIYKL